MIELKQSCLLINKPSGISSNNTLKKIKKKLNQNKAGFSGTLDPLASGLLLIFFNKATKLCSSFLNSDKSYNALIRLGVTSASGDLDGEIVKKLPVPNLSDINIKKLEEKFSGIIEQTPPMYSALKHKGIRMYEYARKGIEIERPKRNVTINNIALSIHDETHLLLKVNCSKGTYIRSLAEAVGEEIGCGALVANLQRTKIGEIDISNAVNLDSFLSCTTKEIFDKYIINVDLLLKDIPSCTLLETDANKILNGDKIKINKNVSKVVKIYDSYNMLIGVGEINVNGELLPKKILV